MARNPSQAMQADPSSPVHGGTEASWTPERPIYTDITGAAPSGGDRILQTPKLGVSKATAGMKSRVAVIGFLEAIRERRVNGWAFRPRDEMPLNLTVQIDGVVILELTCNRVRADVPAARADVRELCQHGAQLGFEFEIPESFVDGAEHELQLLTDDDSPVTLMSLDGSGRRDVWRFQISSVRILGQVEPEVSGARVYGWAIAVDRRTGEKRGRNAIRVWTERDGTIAQLQATLSRPDVADQFGVEPACGFMFELPAELAFGTVAGLHFTALPGNVELRNSPVIVGGAVPIMPPAVDPPRVEGTDAVNDAADEPAAGFVDDAIAVAADDHLADAVIDDTADVTGGGAAYAFDDEQIVSTRFPLAELIRSGQALAIIRNAWNAVTRDEGGSPDYESEMESLIATAFDREYYISTYDDVAKHGIDPVTHFAEHGWRERRRPTPWFDTGYYLDANPDVRASGSNPFWHFLAVGRAEGRRPERTGGYRRATLEKLVPPQEKTRNYFRPSSVAKLLPGHLERRLGEALGGARGLVFSVSHDCYIRHTGGVQIFIADEQAGFNRRGIAYLHASPLHADLVLADPGAPGLLQLVMNGEFLGVASPGDLADVFRRVAPADRVFIVHCLLGHQPEALAGLQAAMRAARNYLWIHDYSSLCEGYNLLRNDISFCQAPPADSLACRVCIYGETRSAHLARVETFFNAVPMTVVAPSRAALQVWQQGSNLPHVKAVVHAHCELEENALRMSLSDVAEPAQEPVRIAFVGYPNEHKGWPVFRELVSRMRSLSCYEFFHFASSEEVPSASGVVRVLARTSPSNRNAMVDALAAHGIDIVLLPAPWPETFSYVTYEALAAGADIVTFASSGNVADVVLTARRGLVVQDDGALFELFESLALVAYVRACRSEGMVAGRLIHRGTTATLHTSEPAEVLPA